MQKPKDYNTYFNADGTPKENPFDVFENSKDAKAMRDWFKRQNEIEYSLMTDAQKAHYRERTRNWQQKVQSSVGGASLLDS